jgi:hypothetical protein
MDLILDLILDILFNGGSPVLSRKKADEKADVVL